MTSEKLSNTRHTHTKTHTKKCSFSSLKMVRCALEEDGKVGLSVHLLWLRAVGRWTEHGRRDAGDLEHINQLVGSP